MDDFDAMSEYDIYTLCSNNSILKRNLAGILPRNYRIRKNDIRPMSYYIVNNSSTEYYGDHWLLFYYAKDTTIFLDPYGWNEDFYNYSEITEYMGKPLQKNIRTLQVLGSSVCAQHCIFVSYHLTLGYKFSTIINHFYTKNNYENDSIVRNFVRYLNSDGKRK